MEGGREGRQQQRTEHVSRQATTRLRRTTHNTIVGLHYISTPESNVVSLKYIGNDT